MSKKLKILISESIISSKKESQEIFQKNLMEPSFLPCDGLKSVEIIERCHPEIVVIEMFMPQMDAVEIINRIRRNGKILMPKFIVISSYGRSGLEREAIRAGVSYFMVKPVSDEDIIKKIQKIINLPKRLNTEKNRKAPIFKLHTPENSDFEFCVTEILHEIGVPAHIKGYYYLRDAIMLLSGMPSASASITKQIYPMVAKNFQTEPSRVERAIRHAIEVAWDRGDTDILNSYFGYTIHTSRGKPTNSEFVAMITDKLKIQRKTAKAC